MIFGTKLLRKNLVFTTLKFKIIYISLIYNIFLVVQNIYDILKYETVMPIPQDFPTSVLLDNMYDALLMLESTTSILYANKAAIQKFSLKKEGKKTILQQLNKMLELENVFATKDSTPIQHRKLALDSNMYMVNAVFVGAHLGLVLHDVSDMHSMAKEYSQNAEQLVRLSCTVDQWAQALLMVDIWGRVVFLNKAMHAYLAPEALKQVLEAGSGEVRGTELLEITKDFILDAKPETRLYKADRFDAAASLPSAGQAIQVQCIPLMRHARCHGHLFSFEPSPNPDNIVGSESAAPETSPSETFFPEDKKHRSPASAASSGAKYALADFVGQSKDILKLKDMVKKVAKTLSTVLIQSESGTGKELLAHALHHLSPRSHGPFVKLNCASLPDTLLESEIFGYEAGAFTGAHKGGHAGRFEQAHGGTIFLDEIGEMPLALQPKLLRIIQEREVQRLGSQNTKQIDVRIICATNKNLLPQMENQLFRSDLFYRLSVVTMTIPPLRDRKEDIKSLVIHYIRKYAKLFQKRVKGVSRDVYTVFMEYSWPGNVRELGNAMEYAFNILDGELIEVQHLPPHLLEPKEYSGKIDGKLHSALDAYAAKIVKNTVEHYRGNKTEAAQILGISRATLYRLLANR